MHCEGEGGELIPGSFKVNEADYYYVEVCSVLKVYLAYILQVHLKVDVCGFGNTQTAAANGGKVGLIELVIHFFFISYSKFLVCAHEMLMMSF